MSERVGRRRWWTAAAVLAPLLLGFSGCNLHTDFVVRETPQSSAWFLHLADGGRYALVASNGAGATVPGAGIWRVDRQTGEAVQISAEPGWASISADGKRVITASGLWNQGTLTPPATGVRSDDLTYRAFVDAGVVKVESLTTGAVRNGEAGFPRPAGTTGVTVRDVSDDGLTVQYELEPSGTVRVARAGAAQALDLPPTSDVNSGPDRSYTMSAGGTSIAELTTTHIEGQDPYGNPLSLPGASKVTLHDVVTRSTITTIERTFENPTATNWTRIDHVWPSDDGRRVWALEQTYQNDQALCGSSTPTIPKTCVTSSRLLVNEAGGSTRSFGSGGRLQSFDQTPDGRRAVFVGFFGPEPWELSPGPKVFDARNGNIETLDWGDEVDPPNPAWCYLLGKPSGCKVKNVGVSAEMSDDTKVIAAKPSSGNGWYDYNDPPEP